MRGDGHDRAGAVLHQDVVGDVDGQPLPVDGICRVVPREHARLLLFGRAVLAAAGRGALHVLAHFIGRDPLDQRVLRCEHEERGAEERVGSGCEDGDVDVELLDPEHDLGTLRTADPVALDRLRPLWPVAPLGQVIAEQLVGVRGDLEEPLLHHSRLDQRAAAVAAPVDDVLVGDHGLVVRAPVDRRSRPVGEAALEELQEQPLRPAVVLDLVRGDLALPVDRPSQPAHLDPDGGDVALGDLARVPALGDGGVLGRQAERVEAHRAQDPQAVPAAEVRGDVAHRVVEDVPHVQRSRRVRQHLELVPVRLVRRVGRRIGRLEDVVRLPDLLPLGFDRLRVVSLHHRLQRQESLSLGEAEGSRRGGAALAPWTTRGGFSSP